MSCRDDAQEQLRHKEARRPQVSWIDPSYCVQPHQDFQLVRESSGNVVEHLHHEMQVQEEETGQLTTMQLTTIKVEKTRWVTTSKSSEGHIMAISRLSTCLTWAQSSPAAPPWIDPCQPPPCQQSPCQHPTCQPPPPSSWSSDQDLSVSSLETENSSLP